MDKSIPAYVYVVWRGNGGHHVIAVERLSPITDLEKISELYGKNAIMTVAWNERDAITRVATADPKKLDAMTFPEVLY